LPCLLKLQSYEENSGQPKGKIKICLKRTSGHFEETANNNEVINVMKIITSVSKLR
jgi:hypothetical protein